MLLHSDTLSCIWTYKSLFLLIYMLHALRRSCKYQFIFFAWPGLKLTMFRDRDEHANRYTTDVIFKLKATTNEHNIYLEQYSTKQLNSNDWDNKVWYMPEF